MNKMLLEVIKNGAALIAVLMAMLVIIGFVSIFSENRVLGLAFEDNSVAYYLHRAGKMLLQTLQAIWSLYVVLAIIVAISLTLLPWRRYFHRMINLLPDGLLEILPQENILSIMRIAGFVFALFIVGTVITNFFDVSNVLHPNSTKGSDMVVRSLQLPEAPQNRAVYTRDFVTPYYRNQLLDYENSILERLFNPLANNNNVTARKGMYSLVFSVLIVTCWFAWRLVGAAKRDTHRLYPVVAAAALTFFAVITLSYTHGVIGTSYIFPVVDVTYLNHENSQIQQRNGLILLREGPEYQTFIARGDYMTMYRIPKTAILILKQRTVIDLFENCAQKIDEVDLCESSYWR